MMKLKLLLLLGLMVFPLCMFSQVKAVYSDELGSAIFTVNSDGIISTNNEMINPLDSDSEINCTSYTPKNPVQFLVGNSAVTVKTCVLDGDKDEEKYGFNVISVYRNNNRVFDLKQSETWAYTYDGMCSHDYRKDTNNRYFVPVKLSDKSTALFFVGWPYGGDLPYLTILVMTEQDAKLVFNKHMGLDSIVKSDNQCVIKIQTGLEEYDSCGKLCVAPIFAQMYLKNGVLYLKQ